MRFDKRVVFYGEEAFSCQLAFVLGIKDYEMFDEALAFDHDFVLIICCNDKLIGDYVKRNRLKRRIDYYYISDVYRVMNKGFVRRLSFDSYRFYLNKHNLINIFHIVRPNFCSVSLINKIPVEFLKVSEMFLKTVNSKQRGISCSRLHTECNVDSDGYLWGCCPGWIKLPFGNILSDDNSYDSYMARVIKLSSLNRTFCFCDVYKCRYNHGVVLDYARCVDEVLDYPSELTVSIDRACNLRCSSCRKCFYNRTDDKTWEIYNKILATGWLSKSDVVLAGQGEVFLSPVYRRMLIDDIKSDRIKLFTNGTLFNRKNWDLVSSIYKEIYVSVSVDAASFDTYKKLRGGNFNYLVKNLRMLGEFRKQGRIVFFQLNFVVQRDNYSEMKDFVNLGKEIGVDRINFTKLNNWGTFSDRVYREKSLIIDNRYLDRSLYVLLCDDVFKDDMVDVESFDEYMLESEKIYGDV